MDFKFTGSVPDNFTGKVALISGSESINFDSEEFITALIDNEPLLVFKIKYERSCSPFKNAMISGNILAVGHQQHFYLFDLTKSVNYLRHKLDGYFGSFVLTGDLFYVADASGIHCIDLKGKRIWYNDTLAVDGVIINRFEGEKIYISAELDPKGGWVNYVLDLSTGRKL